MPFGIGGLLFAFIPVIDPIPIGAYFGIAVSVAALERRSVGTALLRSVRLLRGLRWRMVAIVIAYLILVAITEYAARLSLAMAGIPEHGPGAGLAVLSVAALAAWTLAHPFSVSIYLQARRISDGPSAGELQDVFA